MDFHVSIIQRLEVVHLKDKAAGEIWIVCKETFGARANDDSCQFYKESITPSRFAVMGIMYKTEWENNEEAQTQTPSIKY